MTRICVYCGSSSGNALYLDAATRLGETLARSGIAVVYGGAAIGLMGRIADSALQAGGEVHGVMPRNLADREIAHTGLTALHLTSSMHERKALMAELSDGFIAMPGGLGTLEELFEMWTWSQLGLHAKPVALFNANGYFDHLLKFLDHAASEGFIKQPHRDMLIVSDDPADLVDRIKSYDMAPVDKLSGS